MAVHVAIPTLQGVAFVQSLFKEDDDVHSMVCLNGTSQALPISNAYHDFVKKGQGLIARDFGHSAWRADLSASVELGESWQLGVYLAHWLNALDVLGNGQITEGDTVIWASGAVRVNQSVQAVEGIARKKEHSRTLFAECERDGIDVVVALCDENMAEFDVTSSDSVRPHVLNNVGDLAELKCLLSLDKNAALIAGVKTQKGDKGARDSGNKKAGFAAISLAAVLLGVVVFSMQEQPVETASVTVGRESAALEQVKGGEPAKVAVKLAEPPIKSEVNTASQTLLAEGSEEQPLTAAPMSLHLIRSDKGCASTDQKAEMLELDLSQRFPVINLKGVCELALVNTDMTPHVFTYLLPSGGSSLIALESIEKKDGDKKSAWEVPLPTRTDTRRSALLIVSEAEFSTKAKTKLTKQIGFGLDADLMSPKQIQENLQNKGYTNLLLAGLVLDSF